MAGLQATELAKAGLEGSREIFEPDRGFLKQFSFYPLTWALTSFGEAWVTDTMAFKPWPGCAYIDTAVEAMENILDEIRSKGIKRDQITQVYVRATMMTTSMERLGEKFSPKVTPVRINFSVRYSLATLLEYGKLTPREIARPEQKKLERWATLIQLDHDRNFTRATEQELQKHNIHPFAGLGWREKLSILLLASQLAPDFKLEDLLDFDFQELCDLLKDLMSHRILPIRKLPSLEGLRFPFPSQVIVRLKDGDCCQEPPVKIPRGAPYSDSNIPIKKVVADKFFQEAKPVIGEQRAHEVADLVQRMESWSSPTQLWRLLVKT